MLCDDLCNERRTESALASSHAGAHSALDAVNGCHFERTVESVDDLALADFFAAANDLAVVAVLLDVRFSLFSGRLARRGVCL